MMFGDDKARFSDALGQFGYLAAAVVIVVTGWAVYGAGIRMKASATWVDEALQVLVTIARANESLTQAESAQRSYLLTGLARDLAERNEALLRTRGLIDTLESTLPEVQVPEARRLLEIYERRSGLMREGQQARDRGGLPAAAEWRKAAASRAVNEQFRQMAGQIRAQALLTLDARRRRQQADYDQAILVLVLAVLVSMAVMIPGYAGYVLQSRARRKVESRFAEMANLLPGAVYQFRHFRDGGGRYEFLSRGTAAVRGVDREAALKDPEVILGTLEPAARRRLFELMAAGEETGSPIDFDFTVRGADGSTRWLNVYSAPHREKDGSMLWSGHWSDVTERKAMQTALEESKEAADAANRAKTRFLATMSHEIRTPMNGVLGMLELLSLTELDAEQRSTLAIVRDSGRSLLRIIDDILDFSKVEAGKLELKAEPTSIRGVLERVVNIYRGSASGKGLLFSHSYDDRIAASVLVDPVRLQQILNNLVSNAIKFTSSGEVELRAVLIDRLEGADVVRFTVRDTGIGMTDAERAQLFQPFTQIGSDTERRFGGTGLGLSICRRLVELMGGTIEVQGQAGQGTRMVVTLTLPILDLVTPPASATSGAGEGSGDAMPSLAAPQAHCARVLVVDDHPVNRLVLQKQVAALGFFAESAEDGEVALRKWHAGAFDLIVTDCNMPGMNGYALAREVRATEAREGRERTPMIACTANAMSGEAANCYAAGMDDYIAKPVELRRLAEKLRQWLPSPAADRVMDDSALEAIAVGPESRREVLADFRRYNDADSEALESAIGHSDLPAIAHAAHRIKGASRMVGAVALAAVVERIERSSRAGDWDATVACMEAFRRELGRLNEHIDSGTGKSLAPSPAGESP